MNKPVVTIFAGSSVHASIYLENSIRYIFVINAKECRLRREQFLTRMMQTGSRGAAWPADRAVGALTVRVRISRWTNGFALDLDGYRRRWWRRRAAWHRQVRKTAEIHSQKYSLFCFLSNCMYYILLYLRAFVFIFSLIFNIKCKHLYNVMK